MTDVLHPPKDWLLHIYLASRTSPCKQKLFTNLKNSKNMHMNRREPKDTIFFTHLCKGNESCVELEACVAAHLHSAVCDVNVCHAFTRTLKVNDHACEA